MSHVCTLFGNAPCPVCAGSAPRTPLSLANRPGLSSLRYRIGTFSTFRAAMLDALAERPATDVDASALPVVRRTLTTTDSDDYGIAILEMWAYVCDVLTLYQQAFANESYLGTATLRESLTALTSLIGYEPKPGSSASTWLALLAGRNASAVVPHAFKIASLPPPGGVSTTYETSADVAISEVTNAIVPFGAPTPQTISTSALLAIDENPPVAIGQKIVIVAGTGVKAEDTIVSVQRDARGTLITWNANAGGAAGTQVYRYKRKLRLYGANLPVAYVSLDSHGAPVTTGLFVKAADGTLPLDGKVDGLAAGTALLVVRTGTSKSVDLETIASVGEQKATVTDSASSSTEQKPYEIAVTTVSLTDTTYAVGDTREAVVYELIDGHPLDADANVYSETISGNTFWVPHDVLSGLSNGRRAVLAPAGISVAPFAITLTGVPEGGMARLLPVTFSPPLPNAVPVAGTVIYANAVAATAGTTQLPAVLGDGDASRAWQSFTLPNKPLTYTLGVDGASAALEVFVDDILWTQAPTFYAHGPSDAIYVVENDETGQATIRFGDGKTGRRVPTGRGNVVARYRTGIGAATNADAGRIVTLMGSVPGLDKAFNPIPATGGSAADAPADIVRDATRGIVALDRAVSLADYTALARGYPGVAKARAAWTKVAGRTGVAVAVAAPGGAEAGNDLVARLGAYLDARRDPNVPLKIDRARLNQIHVTLSVFIANDQRASAVRARVEAALAAFAFDARDFGQTVFAAEIVAAIQDVDGVDHVMLDALDAGDTASVYRPDIDRPAEAILAGAGTIAFRDPNDGGVAYNGGISDGDIP